MSSIRDLKCACPHGRPPADVVPGAQYCWACPTRTQVGQYEAVDGQLCWVSTVPGRPVLRRAFAVLLAGAQVRVDDVHASGPSLALRLSDGRNATVAMANVIAAVAADGGGWEHVDAT